MRLCDRCESKNGVGQFRIGLQGVQIQEGKESVTRRAEVDMDLCSVCFEFLREYGLFRFALAFKDSSGVDWLCGGRQDNASI